MNTFYKTLFMGLMILGAAVASGAVYQYLVKTDTEVTVLSGLYFDSVPANNINPTDSISLYPGDNETIIHNISLSSAAPSGGYMIEVNTSDAGLYFNLSSYETTIHDLGNNTYGFTLYPGDDIELYYDIKADIMISPGVYNVETVLIKTN